MKRSLAIIAGGAAGLAAASWIEIPLVPVPITLQTYAVLIVGALLGWRRGLAVVALYLSCAAAGLPVLAGGESGVDRITGPTGGYLVGFAFTVVLVGLLATRGWAGTNLWRSVVTMMLGQAAIVVVGACWLAAQRDWSIAWESGVQPFLIGGLVKGFLAAWTVWLVAILREKQEPPRRAST